MKKIFVATAITAFGLSAWAKDKTYDAQFLDKMTEHHRQGVEMAKIGKDKAMNPELKKMSGKMIEDQNKEIAQMERWRRSDFAKEPKASDLPPKMDMGPLAAASGAEFDHEYVDMMTKHHDSAIEMAKEAEENAATGTVKSFAKKIAKNQSGEKEKLSKLQSGSH